MTNENYTEMTNQELLDIVHKYNVGHRKLATFLRQNNIKLLQELTKRTKFLYPNKGMTQVQMSARLYALEHNLDSHPICANPNCPTHNRVKWLGRSIQKFAQYCCPKCRTSDADFWDRIKQTNLKVRGVEYTWLSPDVIEKTKQTNMERRGVEWYFQSNDFRQKYNNSMMSKYGVEHPLQSKEIMQKYNRTMEDRHDVQFPMQSNILREKSKQTNLRKRGVDNPSKDPNVINKIENTIFEHYGVKHYAQLPEFHKNKKHKFHSEKYPGLTFDSTWEVKVYEFCKDNSIIVEYSPEISYEYEYDGRTWTYHPDFLINGKVYEVKGDQFFRINESSGKEEMFCPYREPEWSDEEYAWHCSKAQAKYQCIIDNDVKLIRRYDMDKLGMIFGK